MAYRSETPRRRWRIARNEALGTARSRFGGLDLPATFIGVLTALGLLVLLMGVAGAIWGAVGFQTSTTVNGTEVAIGGYIVGIIALFLSFFAGGWAAGRSARYDGLINGGFVVVWAMVLGAVFSLLGRWLGTQYDVFSNVHLPQWFTSNVTTASAVITGIIAFLVMVGGALLGGYAGMRYHRMVDEVMVDTGLDAMAAVPATPGVIREQPGVIRDVSAAPVAERVSGEPPEVVRDERGEVIEERDIPPEERRRAA